MTKNTALLPVNVQAVQDRVKQLMKDIGFPDSTTVYTAFMQLANEFSQGCFTDRPTAPQNAALEEFLSWLRMCPYIKGYLTVEEGNNGLIEKIRAALNQPRTVKPLVWEKCNTWHRFTCETIIGDYEVLLSNGLWFVSHSPHDENLERPELGAFDLEYDAKAAAEAHWQAKIRECLV